MNTLGNSFSDISNAMLSQQDNQTTPPIVINSPTRERERERGEREEREREKRERERERERNKHHLQYSHDTETERRQQCPKTSIH